MAGSTRINVPFQQVNESLFELHRPEGNPTMQIIFFHGLQSVNDSDTHVGTWKSEDGSLIWPRVWLVQDFPGAHIFTMSYNECVRDLDMFLVGENLTSDLMNGEIGQVPYCPVILVGYCVGGLVIKQICLQAKKKFKSGKIFGIERKKLGMFLENVRGVFYYGTPHRGSSLIGNVGDGPLFSYFKALNTEAARLNSDFEDLRESYRKWKVHGLGESLRTKSGLFKGHLVAHEAASREGEEFHVVPADHICICQPRNQKDRRFYALKNLIKYIVIDMEEEGKVREEMAVQEARPENFQTLPEELTDMDARVQTIVGKLDTVKKLGFAGMGGLGKTTLAKAVFNKLSSRFEYTCFVPDMKLICRTESDAKRAVWEHLHRHGTKVEGGQSWSCLRAKTFLLVLDDISLQDEKVLEDLARDSRRESRFIATSRNRDLLWSLDEVFDVPFLKYENAEELFMKCAFPKQVKSPKELESIMKDVVKKCDGLPLTLEVLGKYLKRKKKVEEWEETLTALQEAEEISCLNERLWAKLLPSYDDLSENEQQIFLDAAAFFCTSHTWTLRDAKAAWRVAYNASAGGFWGTLVDRSLVYYVEEDDAIKVHEQLQSSAQKIAKDSRVGDGKVGLKMLQNTTDKLDGKEMHALRVGELSFGIGCPIVLLPNAISKLKKVQFLDTFGRITIDGPQNGVAVPTEVVLLRCQGHGGFFNPMLQTRLAVLCVDILVDPLPPSIGQLEHLKHLKILCFSAQPLPDSLVQLRSLQHLVVACPFLESLPEPFGQLSSLSDLGFHTCFKLHTVPDSFGQLKALHSLGFRSCENLESLPKSFGDLKALNRLIIKYAPKLHTLPDSFGQLSTLTELVLWCANLRYLPKSFGQLTRLQRLEIDGKNMQRWPHSFGDLKGLLDLTIAYYSGKSIPDCIQRLPSLQRLELRFKHDLVEPLPPWLATPDLPGYILDRSRMVFQAQDGCFLFRENESILRTRKQGRTHPNVLGGVSLPFPPNVRDGRSRSPKVNHEESEARAEVWKYVRIIHELFGFNPTNPEAKEVLHILYHILGFDPTRMQDPNELGGVSFFFPPDVHDGSSRSSILDHIDLEVKECLRLMYQSLGLLPTRKQGRTDPNVLGGVSLPFPPNVRDGRSRSPKLNQLLSEVTECLRVGYLILGFDPSRAGEVAFEYIERSFPSLFSQCP